MRNKNNLSIVAGILIFIGVVGTLLTYRTLDADAVFEERTFDTERVSMIDLDTNNVGVNIYRTTDPFIKVVIEGNTSSDHAFHSEVDDGTLSIAYDEKRRSWINFDFLNALNPLTINVYLPEKQYDSFKVSNKNGQVFVEQLNANEVELKTNNGRVEMKESDARELRAETNNGQISMKAIIAENVHVQTRNGRIVLDHVEGDIEGETHNGSMSIVTQTIDRNITLKAYNGKITMRTVEEPTNVQFNVSVNNGRVNILDRYEGSATVGNGDHLIELTTHNGSISVTK